MVVSSKAAKEAFVTGLEGGPAGEIYRVFAAVSTAALVAAIISASTEGGINGNSSARIHIRVALWLLAICVWPVLVLCAPDKFAGYHATLAYAITWVMAALLAIFRSKGISSQAVKEQQLNAPRKPFVDLFRANLMAMTVIAILAVDFHAFPRRLAKTETFGTSVMDTGVGLFVSSLGLSFGLRAAKTQSVVASARHSLPLWVLGAVRLVMVKSSDYQEHVSEYGVHWNFFFTLALLGPLIAAYDSLLTMLSQSRIISIKRDIVAAIVVLAIHETSLSALGVADYIATAPRNASLFAQNREGILSMPGYVAIFFLGRALGRVAAGSRSRAAWVSCALHLSAVSALSYIGIYAFDKYLGTRVSRRFANAPFALLSASCSAFAIATSLATCLLLNSSAYAPPLVIALSRHSLLVFLVANLCTGLVNKSFDTLAMENSSAVSLLCVYSLLMGTVALGCERISKSLSKRKSA